MPFPGLGPLPDHLTAFAPHLISSPGPIPQAHRSPNPCLMVSFCLGSCLQILPFYPANHGWSPGMESTFIWLPGDTSFPSLFVYPPPPPRAQTHEEHQYFLINALRSFIFSLDSSSSLGFKCLHPKGYLFFLGNLKVRSSATNQTSATLACLSLCEVAGCPLAGLAYKDDAPSHSAFSLPWHLSRGQGWGDHVTACALLPARCNYKQPPFHLRFE